MSTPPTPLWGTAPLALPLSRALIAASLCAHYERSVSFLKAITAACADIGK